LYWSFILIEDEARFFWVNIHAKLWLALDSDPLKATCRQINTYKVMMTLFWNALGLHARNVLAGE
jgi:hypothetical protein